jgi:DeoR family transcriptional regulator, fructose operon transcriptional repressor
LENQEFVDLETLCRELHASESSIRRDLSHLEQQRLLKRVHGGALAAKTRDHLLDFGWQSTRNAEEKRRIAKRTAALVEDGQTVILDGGSTTAVVASELVGRFLNIITNSLAIAEVFKNARQIELTLTGGYLYPRLEIMLGPLCETMLAGVTADVLIMGIGGITESGLSNNNTLLVGSERKMLEASRKVIIVADHTKFGKSAMVHLAPLDEADVIVTDTALAPEYQEMLRAKGISLILVESGRAGEVVAKSDQRR